MNVTIWNTTEETVSSFFLGGATAFVHCYAIFLCSAIYDYQDEKPCEEKGPDDIQLKDLMTAQSYFLYYTGFFMFISLFTPAVTFELVYPICYLSVFLIHLSSVSFLVYLCNVYIYIFHFDNVKNISVSTMRKRSIIGIVILTIGAMSLSIVVPLQDQPFMFQMLTKGEEYKRLVHINSFKLDLITKNFCPGAACMFLVCTLTCSK